MTFGVALTSSDLFVDPEAIAAAAVEVERLGFDSIWIGDHIVVPATVDSKYPYGSFDPEARRTFFEPLATIGFVAGRTSALRVGVSVLVAPTRNPVYAAKQLATIDALSGGRVILGVGAGWLAEEFEALGWDADHYAARGAVTDEWLRIYRALWSEDPVTTYSGERYELPPVRSYPKPPAGAIPIWVGGNGAASRRRAAEQDGWHALRIGVDELRAGAEDLRRRAEARGREPGVVSLRLHVGRDGAVADAGGTPDQVRERLAAYRDAGCGYFVVDVVNEGTWDSWVRELRWVAETVL